MPGKEDLIRFQAVVQSAQEPMVQRYLEEAYRCFTAEAYNAAIVMAWNAAISYARRAVEEISEPLFAYTYRTKVKKGENPPSELWRVSDNLLIQTCQEMGLMGNLLGEMEPLRTRRNECAHPSGFFASAEDSLAVVQDLHSAVSRQTANERLTKEGILLEFVKETEDDKVGELLGDRILEEVRSRMAHSTLTIFCSEAELKIASVQSMWCGLWKLLDEKLKGHL